MPNQKKILITTLSLLITMGLFADPSTGNEFTCPETDYKLKRSYDSYCEYEERIKFTHTRWDTCYHFFKTYYKESGIYLDKKSKQIWLYSDTHPVMAYIKLNKKEFKKKRRNYWITKGKAFLKELEKTTINCKDPELVKKIESLQCPQTKFSLKEGTGGHCYYSQDTRLSSIFSHEKDAAKSCSEKKYQERISGNKPSMDIYKEHEVIRIFSQKHPAAVNIGFNKKEFNNNSSRTYWIDKGQELLTQLEKITPNCKKQSSPAAIQSKNKKTKVKKTSVLTTKEKSTPKKKRKTSSWDDLGAPSPKAK